jgi:hypothetical protein
MFLGLALDPTLVPVLDPTLISAPSICTKTQGKLAVMVLAASGGQIEHMGFVWHCPLQLLSSRQLDFNCPKRVLIRFLSFVSY